MKNSQYIVLDCETGGLKPTENPITQFAMLTLDQYTLKEVNRYESFVKPYNNLKLDQRALDATMVKMSDINSGIEYKILVKNIINYIKVTNPSGKGASAPIMVGHNVNFDIGFLDYLFKLDGKDIFDYFARGHYDTLLLTKQKFDLAKKKDSAMSYRLTDSAERFGIKLIDAHGAMNDVVATAKLFVSFTEGLRGDVKQVKTNVNETTNTATKSRDRFQF
jgi:DNA polymerase III alpha subunit (gram-positive type)